MMTESRHRSHNLTWLQDSRIWWMVFSTVWVLLILQSGIAYIYRDVVEGGSQNVGAIWKTLTSLFSITFVVLYFRFMYQVYFRDTWDIPKSRVRFIRTAMMGLAVGLNVVPYSGQVGFSFAFVFVAIVFVLTAEPERSVYEVLQICAAAAVVLLLSGNGDRIAITLAYTVAFGFIVGAQHRNFGLIRDLYLERSRVRDQAVTDERFRLARDLHDTVGHSMTQITLKAELARRLLPDDPTRAADELQQIEQLSRSLSTEVRRSIAGEVALSLQSEIERAQELLQSMQIQPTINGDYDRFPEETADVFAWCLREGVMNVIKHSGATKCEIKFSTLDQHHVLKITDNGSNPVNDDHAGQGIAGMKDRVNELDGEVELRTIDSGHELAIRVPA